MYAHSMREDNFPNVLLLSLKDIPIRANYVRKLWKERKLSWEEIKDKFLKRYMGKRLGSNFITKILDLTVENADFAAMINSYEKYRDMATTEKEFMKTFDVEYIFSRLPNWVKEKVQARDNTTKNGKIMSFRRLKRILEDIQNDRVASISCIQCSIASFPTRENWSNMMRRIVQRKNPHGSCSNTKARKILKTYEDPVTCKRQREFVSTATQRVM